MRDPWNDAELARRFDAHSRTAFSRAPLNAAMAGIISRRPRLYGLLGHAPDAQQLPVLLLAAIHFLVLGEPSHPLAAWYPNLTESPRRPDDAQLASTLDEFVSERAPAIVELVATRHVQTNEVGRCALLLPPLVAVGDEVGPIGHLDIGSSAGLNLLLPFFSFCYDDGDVIGDPASSVHVECSTRGTAPAGMRPSRMPEIVRRCGVDTRPIDVTDPMEARWLEACCWPDQADRFHRLEAAIELAGAHPPELLAGDGVDALAPTLGGLSTTCHPVVTTSWTLNYLPDERQRAFVDELDRIGRDIDLSWVFAESPALTPELPHSAALRQEHLTALGFATWRRGKRTVRHLGECHPHGYWIHWA